jgi:hypothetical protein
MGVGALKGSVLGIWEPRDPAKVRSSPQAGSLGFKERSCHHRRYSRADADAREAGLLSPLRSRITLPNAGNPSMSETKSSYLHMPLIRPLLALRSQTSQG